MEIEDYLKTNKIWHRFIEKKETIHTADAAKEAGINLRIITKSLLLIDQNKNLILAIIPGNCKLNFSKVKEAMQVKKIRLVPFEEVEKYTGYLPGATPMVNHREGIKVIIDKKILDFDSVFGGGGNRARLLELKTQDIIRLNNAFVCDISDRD